MTHSSRGTGATRAPFTELALAPRALFAPCDPSTLGFELTSDLPDQLVAVGQDRAVDAIQLSIGIQSSGFNLFVLGPTGSGRSTLTRALIERKAQAEPVPDDWCYVHNFDDMRRPRALRLPAGQGARLRDHFARIGQDLTTALSSAFDNRSYRDRREAIEHEIEGRHEREMTQIAERAQQNGIAVLRTPSGLTIGPQRDGRLLDPEEQAKLSPEDRTRLESAAQTVHDELSEALRHVPQLQREQRERIRALDHEITRGVVDELLAEARQAFAAMPHVLEHLDRVANDIVERAAELLHGVVDEDGDETPLPLALLKAQDGALLRRYRVNLLVDHRSSSGAPVVLADHPSSGNLVGKVEHTSQLGVLITDFNLIEAGALHRANGGYLILDARRVLSQPVAYEQLKRTLRAGEIRIESVAEALDLSVAVTLEPEPIPWKGKVVLIGEAWLFHSLCAADPELEELFKIAADFESDIPRTEESSRGLAQLFAHVARKEQLRPLDAAAVARLLEQASRMAEDSTRFSMHVRMLFDVMREADHWAGHSQRQVTTAADVVRALDERRRRHGQLRERVLQSIHDGTVHVETQGEHVGQINGLSYVEVGQSCFGFPSRITARVRMGKGDVLDIERETQLGGPIHSKGVLILGAFLGARYQRERPLSLHASLVFEQSYGHIEGDSASLAELLTLLSAISGLPLAQNIAVTGSIDQHGRVQAVGGVNEKLEGFFDVCRARGLDGSHGAILPASNRKHLMLRRDLVEAAERGDFRVWPVSSADEAMRIAFGREPGVRGADERYEVGTVNHAVEAGLEKLAKAALDIARSTQPRSADSLHAVMPNVAAAKRIGEPRE